MSISLYEYNKAVVIDRLVQEISSSSILTALDRVDLEGSNDLKIYFKDELSQNDEQVLDNLVEAHQAIPLVESPRQVSIVDSVNPPPFASKVLSNGKKLFRRKHGVSGTIEANSSGTLSLVIPYALAKINKVEIVNCAIGDTADLKVYDTPTGTISTVPNYMLNQFGFDVCLPDNFYVDESNYDADLIQNMKIEITYKNNSSEDREVGINIVLHQLV